jgi:hypothetical protein
MTTKLSRDDMIMAVTQGAREAFLDVMTDCGNLAVVSASDFCRALTEGAAQAIWRVATNATDMPSSDFYDAIQRGTAEGFARVRSGEEE